MKPKMPTAPSCPLEFGLHYLKFDIDFPSLMTVLDRVRRLCLGHPGAYEKIAWSAPTFRVGERQFAMFVDNHHGVGFAGVWLRAPEGAQEELVTSDPERFYVPPYVGTAGWVGVRVDAKTSWKLLAGLLAEAYRGAAATQSAARIERGAGPAKATGPKPRPRPRSRRKRLTASRRPA